MPTFIEWLQKNSGNFRSTVSKYYYYENEKLFDSDYYTHNIDAQAVKNELNALSDHQKKTAIAERNSQRQNAFHVTLSNKIYLDWQATNIAMPTNNFKSNWQNEKDVDMYRYSNRHLVQANIDHHAKMLSTGCAKQFKEIVKDQLTLITDELLSPFKGDDEALTDVLTAEDKLAKTPLHYAYETPIHYQHYQIIQKLETRISEIKDEKLKTRIALAKDSEGQTVFHTISKRWNDSGLTNAIKNYGEKATLAALRQPDNKQNTLLHTACASRHDCAVSRIQVICSFLDSITKNEKAPSPTQAIIFRQNSAGENPLHLAAQNRLDLLTPLCKAMDPALRETKIKETDAKGFTPLHYAIQSNNIDKVRALMNNFSAEKKQNLFAIRTRNNESALHLACRYGNPAMLREVLENMSPIEINQILQSSRPALLRLVTQNSQMSSADCTNQLNQYDRLFNVYRYLEKRVNEIWFSEHVNTNSDFNTRLTHFATTLTALTKGEALPNDQKQFSSSRFFQSNRYQTALNEAGLSNLTQAELERFKTFLTSQASNQQDGQDRKQYIIQRLLSSMTPTPTADAPTLS
jgi:ankyrin repeat protein